MTTFIRFFRAILTLVEVFCFNPPADFQENESEKNQTKEPDFL